MKDGDIIELGTQLDYTVNMVQHYPTILEVSITPTLPTTNAEEERPKTKNSFQMPEESDEEDRFVTWTPFAKPSLSPRREMSLDTFAADPPLIDLTAEDTKAIVATDKMDEEGPRHSPASVPRSEAVEETLSDEAVVSDQDETYSFPYQYDTDDKENILEEAQIPQTQFHEVLSPFSDKSSQ